MGNKTIHISKETWLILNQIKLDFDLATMNDALKFIIVCYKEREMKEDKPKINMEEVIEGLSQSKEILKNNINKLKGE